MNTITIEELSELCGYGKNAIRTYLQGYRFTKFEKYVKVENRLRLVYKFNQDFIDELTKYMWKVKKTDIKENLQKKLLSLAEQENSPY